jgi:hypothetical protein
MNIDPETHHEPPATGIKWLDVSLAVGVPSCTAERSSEWRTPM